MGTLIVLCRPGLHDALAEEIADRYAAQGLARQKSAPSSGQGIIRICDPSLHHVENSPLSRPLIFERQRMENAVLIPSASVKAMARGIISDVLPAITTASSSWTLHAFSAGDDERQRGDTVCRSFASTVLAMCRERFSAVYRRYVPGGGDGAPKQQVLQVCLTDEGVWGSVMPYSRLSSPFPGGIARMAFDNRAPSRSFLKIEESFQVMGEQPVKGQTAVDLGAAPGGWTWAFLKRGCRVIAVDNGPIKINPGDIGGGDLVHVRADGISYRPGLSTVPVDWLASDMLVAAGKDIGMLRKWIENRWMRRFIVNVKLPQQQPYAAVKVFDDYLAQTSGVTYSLRHLCHDRREVTAMGYCAC